MTQVVVTPLYDSLTDSNAMTITLASLATSPTSVAGRESTFVSNVSNLFSDVYVTGQITTGTTPTVATYIELYLYYLIKHVSSTPTFPSPFTGSDAGVTLTAETKARIVMADQITVNNTSNVAYAIRPFSVARLCDGIMPLKWGLCVVHNTGVALNATAGNHWIHYQGLKQALN